MGASAEAESVADHCDGPRVGGGESCGSLGVQEMREDLDG